MTSTKGTSDTIQSTFSSRNLAIYIFSRQFCPSTLTQYVPATRKLAGQSETRSNLYILYLSAYFFSSAFRTIFIFNNVKHHRMHMALPVLSMPMILWFIFWFWHLFPEVTLRCHSQFQKSIRDKTCLLMLLKEIRSVKDRSDMQMRNWLVASWKKNPMPASKILYDLFWKSKPFIGFKSSNLVQSWIKISKWTSIIQMH